MAPANTGLLLVAVATNGAVSVKVTEAVVWQPLASVMVTVNVPAFRLIAVAVVCAGVLFHEYV